MKKQIVAKEESQSTSVKTVLKDLDVQLQGYLTALKSASSPKKQNS